MKKIDDLKDLMSFIIDKHTFVHSQYHGGYGVVLLRKPDGQHALIQEMRYFRIEKYEILDRQSVMVYNFLLGTSLKGKRSASSSLYLTDLLQVNVFDHSTHFVSDSRVDFAYVEQEESVRMKVMQSFIHNEPGVIRAQWSNPQGDVIDNLLLGQKIKHTDVYRRNLDLETDIL